MSAAAGGGGGGTGGVAAAPAEAAAAARGELDRTLKEISQRHRVRARRERARSRTRGGGGPGGAEDDGEAADPSAYAFAPELVELPRKLFELRRGPLLGHVLADADEASNRSHSITTVQPQPPYGASAFEPSMPWFGVASLRAACLSRRFASCCVGACVDL